MTHHAFVETFMEQHFLKAKVAEASDIQGTKVDLDNIVKPFPSTSAYLQSHNCLKTFAALKLCQKHLVQILTCKLTADSRS